MTGGEQVAEAPRVVAHVVMRSTSRAVLEQHADRLLQDLATLGYPERTNRHVETLVRGSDGMHELCIAEILRLG
jgi:hypothetical protein